MARAKKRKGADAQLLASTKIRKGCFPRTKASCGSGMCSGKPNFVQTYKYQGASRGPYCRGKRGTTPSPRGTKRAEAALMKAASAYASSPHERKEKPIQERMEHTRKKILSARAKAAVLAKPLEPATRMVRALAAANPNPKPSSNPSLNRFGYNRATIVRPGISAR